ncbi:PLP-dependent aminotransferase family protein [Cronobacter malonaticus]|uniref:aminotransferase-like domain-containing protein n=1 Tax=Cronobacter malonaticus TaxID=413503 RepID=UPI00188B82BA|nr:PLP-dependent aminotransferase family protein [Cronobacter malonaticus]MBF4661117.1 PLP-dependent aminotransferase family protein [Cronobacter malonaticus]MBF4837722.1 PLP-dependent aminotransferase family protein [Cronobacter malonaticus]MBF4843933.1 PLP-dependent aminotransferase family protein [Cronobacter malonaticus]MBF4847518.1 PLP-dependent aminotransferase family protein [Cronobacter malonaticus]MBF4862904.1 PLP-dependent aminotransferase family protein [Cronobacter malonaticus]
MKARYKTLVDRFAAAIRSGELTAGVKLPTHRRLAVEHHVSLATATRVYAELEAMGLVSGETGRGTFVRDIALPPGLGIDQHAVAADALDLSFNYPALPGQAERLRDALRQLASAGDIEALLRYQPHAGRAKDRETIAAYLAGAGLNTAPENVLVVSGAQHGLAVSVMSLLRPGDVVAVDALTYPGFKVAAQLCHIELVAVPCTPQGPDLAALQALCEKRRVRAVYTMPTLHNPIGWVLTPRQRRALVAIARQYDLLLIEDAPYAWLVKPAPVPLAALAPERTVYVTGFSKNIATGLRVGAVVCPPRFLSAFERTIRATAWNTPALMTTLVCDWLRDGTVNRFETLKRRDARARQRLAREVLAPLEVMSHPSSYFIWLPLREGVRAEQVAQKLLQKKISVSTAEPFSTTFHTPHAIRLALGSLPLETLRQALETIRETVLYEENL